jgi:hypothetical protein
VRSIASAEALAAAEYGNAFGRVSRAGGLNQLNKAARAESVPTGVLQNPLNGPGLPPAVAVSGAVEAKAIPGVAFGGEKLPAVTGTWLRGTEGNLGLIPKQIAGTLRGQYFASFDDFRAAFWRAVAADPVLSKQFRESNRTLMSDGFAPFAAVSQQTGPARWQQVYNLHHINPVHQGGKVYDMDNIVIVTPRLHEVLLDPAYHYGK